MMLLTRVIASFLLIVLVQAIEVNERVLTVTCDDQLIDSEEFIDGLSKPSYNYCINGNCSYPIDNLVEDLSNDSVINITCDMELSSVIIVVGLMNITIAGYNNPTVGCNGFGGLHFISCHGIKIEGITWDRCGSENRSDPANSAIKFNKSSTILIQHCTLQQSVGSAISLTEISGTVMIDHCMFLNNTKCSGPGTAIYCQSESSGSPSTKLSLQNSYFRGNKGVNSIIYLNSSKENQYLSLGDSVFIDNKNVIFHLVNQNFHISNTSFTENQKISRLLYAKRSDIYFNGNSKVQISNSTVPSFLLDFSSVTFMGHSRISFNSSDGAIALYNYSNLTFNDNCVASFNNINSNNAIFSSHSGVAFKGSSTVLFSNNNSTNGAAILSANHSSIAFQGNSTISFTNNTADNGGAISSRKYSRITFEESSSVTFSSNKVSLSGAAILSQHYSYVTFKGQSKAIFNYNIADNNGGGIYLYDHCNVTFDGHSEVSYQYNEAYGEGGGVFCKSHCSVRFTEFSRVIFNDNIGSNAGALRGINDCLITFDENCETFFIRNNATNNGGAMDLYGNTDIIFKGNSSVNFANNMANREGGACVWFSNVTFAHNATVMFNTNTAPYGGAVALLDQFHVVFQTANLVFTNNEANYGGATACEFSDGGKLRFDMQRIGVLNFYNNIALIWGNSMLIDDIPESCNKSCLIEELQGITYMGKLQRDIAQHITTAPYKVIMEAKQHPIICTEFDEEYNDCTEYHINDVMLGQVVPLKTYVYDYLDNLTPREIQFEIHSLSNANYSVEVPQTPYQEFDISINGNRIISKYNYSMSATTFYYDYKYQRKDASIKLSIELSPCYLGFQHNSASRRCECYDRGNIVLCTGSSSFIKRGYWLGTVEEKSTTAICPMNYCNFICCETNNGYHSLSPGRENQCTSHRSGIACGSCEEGYTLSYAAECVSVNRCTAGWTVLVVTSTMIYWIVIVIGVFAMMYYKLPIGYLYAITYYYSMLDVLLNQNLHIYQSLHITTNILCSVFKLDPQFLGQLCLVEGLSAIDAQFIDYIHPLAISIILAIITLIARCSQRLSSCISRGIIHVICFLLLLSYTSIVSTSLLLLRSLNFYNVDKVYTYLSPDIEYFHGRHLAYFVVAIICIITIIIGLPLILLLEPFLNHKINLIQIKPLLDQFQGCFKDQYRWFAAYYMICRLIQIAIVVYSSDYLTTQYFLTTANVIVSLVHMVIRPYNNKILNVFDGFILQLMAFVVVLPVFDTMSSTVIFTVTFILVILPLLNFLIMGFIVHKGRVKKFIITNCTCNAKRSEVAVNDSNQISVRGIDVIIVDESMRRNATVCDV